MQPRKVLVIDDSGLIHQLFRFTLHDQRLVFASNGLEALARLGENPDVDLIFLDINMPKMNGLELLAKIKADKALAGIPVIVISTEGKEHDVVRGLQAGAAGYVRKPFGSDEITSMMARLLAFDDAGEPEALAGRG
jgi:two-component system chemotaxis response regulator CheY